MSVLDSAILPVVVALLNGTPGVANSGFGTPATLIVSNTGYIPELDQDITAPPSSYPFFISPPDSYSVKDQWGNSTQTKSFKAIMPGLIYDASGIVVTDSKGIAIVPHVGDSVAFGGNTYRVIEIAPIMSGSVTAAYELQLGA